MPISYIENGRFFKMDTATSTYVVQVFDQGILLCPYYGAKNPDTPFDVFCFRDWFSSFSPSNESVTSGSYSSDVFPLEYSGFGVGDFRKTAVAIRNADGNNCTDFRYVSHRIYAGRSFSFGLPA